MTEYLWVSPGGVYHVPPAFKAAFLRDFPDYRIRWSLRRQQWHIEQRCGVGHADTPISVSPLSDDLIRAADGYWLYMTNQPGLRMACPSVVTRFPERQLCGLTLAVPRSKHAEVVCPSCKLHGRDGRHMVGFYPWGDDLLTHMRHTSPLRDWDGVNGITIAKLAADAHNASLLASRDRAISAVSDSIDAVDQRWLQGIASSTGVSRQVDATTFR